MEQLSQEITLKILGATDKTVVREIINDSIKAYREKQNTQFLGSFLMNMIVSLRSSCGDNLSEKNSQNVNDAIEIFRESQRKRSESIF